MAMKIFMDGHEVRNPLARFVIGIGVAVVTAALAGVVLLVLLPLTGVVMASWLVFVATVVGFVAALAAFSLRRSLFASRYDAARFRNERHRTRDEE